MAVPGFTGTEGQALFEAQPTRALWEKPLTPNTGNFSRSFFKYFADLSLEWPSFEPELSEHWEEPFEEVIPATAPVAPAPDDVEVVGEGKNLLFIFLFFGFLYPRTWVAPRRVI